MRRIALLQRDLITYVCYFITNYCNPLLFGDINFRKQIKDTLDTSVKVFSHASKNWFTVRHTDPLKVRHTDPLK